MEGSHTYCVVTHQVVGGFSAVSVPDMYGKKGIGSFLVTAAETYLLDKVLEDSNDKTLTSDVIMEMGVCSIQAFVTIWKLIFVLFAPRRL